MRNAITLRCPRAEGDQCGLLGILSPLNQTAPGVGDPACPPPEGGCGIRAGPPPGGVRLLAAGDSPRLAALSEDPSS
ncbi:unnamed protein product [Gadus morhua 'NCC']